MSSKSFELDEGDPVAQQFESGLEAWEHPIVAPSARETRQGGTVRTRGGVLSRGPDMLPPTELPEDDPVVKRFKEGLADWERPFEPGDKQDG